MSTWEDPTSAGQEASSRSEDEGGRAKSDQFKALTAMRLARRVLLQYVDASPERCKGIYIVGMLGICDEMILMTPSWGRFEATLADLTKTTRASEVTLRNAIRVMVDAGVVKVRRRGSVANVYAWTELLYRRRSDPGTPVPDHQTEGAPTSPPILHSTTVRRVVLAHYLDARERRYLIPAAAGYHRLSEETWQAIELRFALLASLECAGEDAGAVLDRLVVQAMGLWFARKGRGNSTWLRDNKHPLERLAEDLDWLTEKLRSPANANRPVPQAVVSIAEQLRTARANRDRGEIERLERLLSQSQERAA